MAPSADGVDRGPRATAGTRWCRSRRVRPRAAGDLRDARGHVLRLAVDRVRGAEFERERQPFRHEVDAMSRRGSRSAAATTPDRPDRAGPEHRDDVIGAGRPARSRPNRSRSARRSRAGRAPRGRRRRRPTRRCAPRRSRARPNEDWPKKCPPMAAPSARASPSVLARRRSEEVPGQPRRAVGRVADQARRAVAAGRVTQQHLVAQGDRGDTPAPTAPPPGALVPDDPGQRERDAAGHTPRSVWHTPVATIRTRTSRAPGRRTRRPAR